MGGGGREHAMAWKLAQSPRLGTLWLTDPGNVGLAALGQPCPPELADRGAFYRQRWCEKNNIHLVIVGPEAPLAEGVADELATDERLVFGPTRAAAQLEANKTFAKEIMRHAAVPTAEGRTFARHEAAVEYLTTRE